MEGREAQRGQQGFSFALCLLMQGQKGAGLYCLILALVTPSNANPSCKESPACSEQDCLVGGMW